MFDASWPYIGIVWLLFWSPIASQIDLKMWLFQKMYTSRLTAKNHMIWSTLGAHNAKSRLRNDSKINLKRCFKSCCILKPKRLQNDSNLNPTLLQMASQRPRDPPPSRQNDPLKAPKWPQHAPQSMSKRYFFKKCECHVSLTKTKWFDQLLMLTKPKVSSRTTAKSIKKEPRTHCSTELPRRCANLSISKRSFRFIIVWHRFWRLLASILAPFGLHFGPKPLPKSTSKCYFFKKCALHVWPKKTTWFDQLLALTTPNIGSEMIPKSS